MITDKYELLIKKLISGTEKKLISWEQTSLQQEYKAKIGLGSIVISLSEWHDINGDMVSAEFKFCILNDEGILSDEIVLNSYSPIENWNLLNQLYVIAKDSCLKTSDTIQSMLDELNKLDEVL